MVQIAQSPIEINGKEFSTVKEAALYHGITLKAITHQMRHYHLSLEQAFAVAVNSANGTNRRAKSEDIAARHRSNGTVLDLFLIKSPDPQKQERVEAKKQTPPPLSYWRERHWIAELKLMGFDLSGLERMHEDPEPDAEPDQLYLPAAE